jgi:hypothetical protein
MTSFHVTKSDREYAERLTRQIKAAADDLWSLLLQAWESKAHISLGYKTWGLYIEGEFDFSRQQSYRLVNQGQVIRQLREAVNVSPVGDNSSIVTVSEREARAIAPVISEVVEDVRESVASGVPAVEAVRLAVETHRSGPGFTLTQFNNDFTEEPASCAHEYVCRHCGELLQ